MDCISGDIIDRNICGAITRSRVSNRRRGRARVEGRPPHRRTDRPAAEEPAGAGARGRGAAVSEHSRPRPGYHCATSYRTRTHTPAQPALLADRTHEMGRVCRHVIRTRNCLLSSEGTLSHFILIVSK